jgi:hypothetical protein
MFKRFIMLALAGLSILPAQTAAWVGYHGGGFVRGPNGGVAAWHGAAWGGGWHGGYHAVPVYHGGCWGCVAGASAGAVAAAGVVGLAAGAAIGSAAASASSPTVVVQQPVYVTAPGIGSTVVSLPGDCTSATVNGTRYYGCGSTYYQPHFGNSGVYYTVVPNPF